MRRAVTHHGTAVASATAIAGRTAATAAATNAVATVATTEAAAASRRRDRHRRGDRGDRPERGEAPTGTSSAEHRDTPMAPESPAATLEATATSHMEAPPPAMASAPVMPTPAHPVFDPSEAETVINLATTPRTPVPEIVTPSKPVEAQPRPVSTLPPVSMSLPADSGLELVETRSKATLVPEPETVPAGPRRVRPPRPVI